MLIIGLTGGAGSGKSVVASEFAKHGITIVDADKIAREILEPGQNTTKEVVARFGQSILDGDEINRRALRDIILNDTEAKTWLNSLMHPIIRSRMNEYALKSTTPYTICVVPLLFENNLASQYNRILVIDCSEQVQIERIMARDSVDEGAARALLAAQTSREARLAGAHDVINNTGDLAMLNKQVTKLHNKYLEISKKSS